MSYVKWLHRVCERLMIWRGSHRQEKPCDAALNSIHSILCRWHGMAHPSHQSLDNIKANTQIIVSSGCPILTIIPIHASAIQTHYLPLANLVLFEIPKLPPVSSFTNPAFLPGVIPFPFPSLTFPPLILIATLSLQAATSGSS